MRPTSSPGVRSPGVGPPGVGLFARYAHAPNALGFCGPPTGLGRSEDEVRAAARRFSGAWPYLQVLARLTRWTRGSSRPTGSGATSASTGRSSAPRCWR